LITINRPLDVVEPPKIRDNGIGHHVLKTACVDNWHEKKKQHSYTKH